MDFADFWPILESEVGARNGQERVECGPERPIQAVGEVRRRSEEPARVRGNWRDQARKNPNRERLGFQYWWWGGTLRQTYVTQRLTTASNSSGKVRNPAPTADNPTSSALAGSPTERIRQNASSIPICGIEPASAIQAVAPSKAAQVAAVPKTIRSDFALLMPT